MYINYKIVVKLYIIYIDDTFNKWVGYIKDLGGILYITQPLLTTHQFFSYFKISKG